MTRFIQLLAGMTAALFVQLALAQEFPSKAVRIIVTYAPGGLVDTLARVVASSFSESIGQPVIVENKPGAATAIGMHACAQAAPDGYTLCFTSVDSLSYLPNAYKRLPYDADKDFAPVINVAWGINTAMIVANQEAPFNSIGQLIEYAKAKPGVVNWATWGPASIPDLYLQWIKHHGAVDIVAVPYKSAGPSMGALVAGQVHVTFLSTGPALSHIKSGKLKALAAIGNRRSSHTPNVPTLDEQGYDPGLRSYFGVFAPSGTPEQIVGRLNAEFAKAIEQAPVKALFQRYMLDAGGGSAAEFAAYVKKDRQRAGEVFRQIGIVPTDAPFQ